MAVSGVGYKRDIVKFAEEQYILPETKRPIVLQPHQKLILQDCFTRDSDGRFPFQTIIYSTIKKSGKTEIAGLVGLWYSLTEAIYNETYFLANDLEQSMSRGFKRISQVCRVNPKLRNVQVKRDRIYIPANGNEIYAISSDYAGAAGANQGLTLWDELWAYQSEHSRRLWDEMSPVPTRLNSLRFISTYAGFEGESVLLWDLYQKGLGGRKYREDPPVWINEEVGLYMYWDTEPRMPWQTERFLKERQSSERPSAFRRLYQNQWVAKEESFIPPEMWDACINVEMSKLIVSVKEPLFVGVDIGLKRDSSAVVAVYWDRERKKIRLAHHAIWQPQKNETLDLESTVEEYIMMLNHKFRVGSIYYDPSQFVRSAQLLRGQGIALHEYTQVPTNLTAMTQTFYELIRGRNLEMYFDKEMRQQMLDCVVLTGPRGMRIAKEKASQKIDVIVAMAMACQAAWDGAGITPLPDNSDMTRATKWDAGLFSKGNVPTMVESSFDTGTSRWRI